MLCVHVIYFNCPDSVRAFKQRMKMGQFKDADPEEQKRIEEEKQKKEQEEQEKVAAMKAGDRCVIACSFWL